MPEQSDTVRTNRALVLMLWPVILAERLAFNQRDRAHARAGRGGAERLRQGRVLIPANG